MILEKRNEVIQQLKALGFTRFSACKTNKQVNKQAGPRKGSSVKQAKELVLGRDEQNLGALWEHEKIRKEI